MTSKLPPQDMADQAKEAYQSGDCLEAAQEFGEAAEMYADLGDSLQTVDLKIVLFMRPC